MMPLVSSFSRLAHVCTRLGHRVTLPLSAQRRYASFYNYDVAGLTDEETEV